jgi:hypothetical protein
MAIFNAFTRTATVRRRPCRRACRRHNAEGDVLSGPHILLALAQDIDFRQHRRLARFLDPRYVAGLYVTLQPNCS